MGSKPSRVLTPLTKTRTARTSKRNSDKRTPKPKHVSEELIPGLKLTISINRRSSLAFKLKSGGFDNKYPIHPKTKFEKLRGKYLKRPLLKTFPSIDSDTTKNVLLRGKYFRQSLLATFSSSIDSDAAKKLRESLTSDRLFRNASDYRALVSRTIAKNANVKTGLSVLIIGLLVWLEPFGEFTSLIVSIGGKLVLRRSGVALTIFIWLLKKVTKSDLCQMCVENKEFLVELCNLIIAIGGVMKLENGIWTWDPAATSSSEVVEGLRGLILVLLSNSEVQTYVTDRLKEFESSEFFEEFLRADEEMNQAGQEKDPATEGDGSEDSVERRK